MNIMIGLLFLRRRRRRRNQTNKVNHHVSKEREISFESEGTTLKATNKGSL
jgi:hypothetical protein